MNTFSRQQRGMTMVETLIVLGIAAFAVIGVVGMVDVVMTTLEAERNAHAIRQFDAGLHRFKTVRRVCGGTAPTNAIGVIGAAVTLAQGETSPPNSTATDAEERCENQMWETFTSGIRRPNDVLNGEGLIAYDDDAAAEWLISAGGEEAIETGWHIWPPSGAAAWNAMVDGVTTITTDVIPCNGGAGATGPAAIAAFALSDMDVCEATRNKFSTTPRGIYSTACFFADTGTSTRNGDALLLACILNTDV